MIGTMVGAMIGAATASATAIISESTEKDISDIKNIEEKPKVGRNPFMWLILIEGSIFAGIGGLFAYVVIKLALALHGVTF